MNGIILTLGINCLGRVLDAFHSDVRIRKDDIRKRLISQGNILTLDFAVRLCRSHEVTPTAIKSMGVSIQTVDAVQTTPTPRFTSDKRGHGQRNPAISTGRERCTGCGKETHSTHRCPVMTSACRNCQKIEHWIKGCRSKAVNEGSANEATADEATVALIFSLLES